MQTLSTQPKTSIGIKTNGKLHNIRIISFENIIIHNGTAENMAKNPEQTDTIHINSNEWAEKLEAGRTKPAKWGEI